MSMSINYFKRFYAFLKAAAKALSKNVLLKIYVVSGAIFLLAACTQEQQNKLGRGIQNWTGTNGTLEIYAGEKLVKRFMRIDKLTTGIGTSDNNPRPYRYGYGYLDSNLNGFIEGDEKRVYFEFSDYGSNYIFFEQP